jgi:hypothetical protein
LVVRVGAGAIEPDRSVAIGDRLFDLFLFVPNAGSANVSTDAVGIESDRLAKVGTCLVERLFVFKENAASVNPGPCDFGSQLVGRSIVGDGFVVL